MYKEVLIEGTYNKDGVMYENSYCLLKMSNNKYSKRLAFNITDENVFGDREHDTQFIEINLDSSIEDMKELVLSGFQFFVVNSTANFTNYTIKTTAQSF